MKKRITCLLLAVVLVVGYMPAASAQSDFLDVPAGHWAENYIGQAVRLGVIKGYESTVFGLGDRVTRAQFAAMLTRLFGWQTSAPETPSFEDNADTSKWYYAEIETAVAHGAVKKDSARFRPADKITRAEMAIMLVRALGYDTLAQSVPTSALPFADVSAQKGYIAIAYDFGIIDGMSDTRFSPDGFATREQAAAMIIRLHEKYAARNDWTHAFYAISSYSQRSYIPELDGVSFGWSRLEWSAQGGVTLNQSTGGGNVYGVPSGSGEVYSLAQDNGVPANLSVFMSTAQAVTLPDGTASDACREILLDADAREAAVSQIADALSGEYDYSGVTIDFELLRGAALREGFVSFVKLLRERTQALGKSVYVCVHPATEDAAYYDGYDYRAIGRLCDRVILMAHDYQASKLTASEMSAGFTTTPLTPFPSVYYALKAVTDARTGVEDTEKIALALSFGSVGWSLRDGKVIAAGAMHPTMENIYDRLISPGTVKNYSEKYQNPYISYYDGSDDTENIVWYENTRSVQAKLQLARMFGINGVSVWRLGLVPYYNDAGISYDVADALFNG